MADGAILVAEQGAMFNFEGQKVFLVAGQTTVREGHPILKGHEHLFKPLKVDFEVEQDQGKDAGSPKQASRARKPAARGDDSEQQ